MNDPRGSIWRKWDLHVHTPDSLCHNYGGGDDVWEKFITALEELPKDFSVIGVNDYLFLDGYKKLLEAKAKGRMRNIQTFLPVLEFRLANFAGTDGRLRRINFHVIFSDALTASQIEQQFLMRLTADYQLTPEASEKSIRWSGVLTRESLMDLGEKLIASTPEQEKCKFNSPLIEGFNNLNLSIETIKAALSSPYFENNYVTAVGKTEWASLKWNDQSIAEKKNLINQASIVFISADNPASYENARESLRVNGVNDRLLDCSDAHNWGSSADKDSLGKCDLWIKADPTFRGLQHALYEFEERVYVGSEPEKVSDQKQRPHKYIDSITIRKNANSIISQKWFDSSLSLNPGLVAIIGNKGNGKSALADILALGGNSYQEQHFSFLNERKFRNSRDNKSQHFRGELTWQSSEKVSFGLSDSAHKDEVERVRYIPQSYLEKLCNEFATEGGNAFDIELRAVIFSHIPAAERLGKQSLGALIDYLGEETYDRINNLKGDLSKINREISSLEDAGAPERKREIEKKLTSKQKELATLKKAEPKAVTQPDLNPESKASIDEWQRQIDEEREKVAFLEKSVAEQQSERKLVLARVAQAEKILQRIRNLEEQHRQIERESEAELTDLGLRWQDLITFSSNQKPLKDLVVEFSKKQDKIKQDLDSEVENSLSEQLSRAKKNIAALQNQLDAPMRLYQEYLSAHKQWKEAVIRLESDTDDSESIASLNAELERIAELPKRLKSLEDQRLLVCRQIFGQLDSLREQFRRLYQPVQEFIRRHRTLADSIMLSFDVHIGEMNLTSELSEWINKGRAGAFQGAEQGEALIKEIVQRNSFDSEDGVTAFLSDFMNTLKHESVSDTPRTFSTRSQLKASRKPEEFYDFLFGLDYLKPRYALKMDEKEIQELSPGERGLLLLLFYLLIEKSDGPLILDQPEENLDNETVHKVLVPSIQLAKRRRQIIVVTHNPNLAVVADADQIISASIDKKGGCAVTYVSGALENPAANGSVLRYLEGTLPAFMNRDRKYIRGN